MKSVFKLIHSYYFNGFYGPFFIILFPIIMMAIMGEITIVTMPEMIPDGAGGMIPYPDAMKIAQMRTMISGLTITSLIATGIISLPMTIVDFKTSTLIKRVGATDVKKSTFLIAILAYQSIWGLFSLIWVPLWGGIILGSRDGLNWSIAFHKDYFSALPFAVLVFIQSIAMGILVAAISKNSMAANGIANLLYMPISIFSGGFFPLNMIMKSNVLSAIAYGLPTRYFTEPFTTVFTGGWDALTNMGWEAWGFPLIGLAFTIVILALAVKKFKWGS